MKRNRSFTSGDGPRRSSSGAADAGAERAASAARTAVRDVAAPLEAEISGADRAADISLVAVVPLVEGFPPRASLTELAGSVARPEAVTGVRPLKPPSRWAGELGQAIDSTAGRVAFGGRPGPGHAGGLAVADAVERHLGSVRMAAEVVVVEGDGCPATWRKSFVLVTRSHIAWLALTVDD